MADGFFPLGVTHDELAPLVDTVRLSAAEAGRDPASVEITVQGIGTAGEEARAEVKALEERGVTRVLIPAVLFGVEPAGKLVLTART